MDVTDRPWLVCVATAHELRPLKRCFGLMPTTRSDSVPCFEGRAGRHRLMVLQTGIGPDRARRAVATWLEQRMCRGVVSVGVSGGLQGALGTGVLVIGDRWIRIEARAVHDQDELLRHIGPPADRRLRGAAILAAGRCGVAVHEGILATAEQLIGTVQDKRALAGRTGALAVDMESGAVAEAAIAAGVAVVAARVILDPADEALELSPESFLREDGSPSIWKSGLAVMTGPVQWPVLWNVGRRTTRAMELLTQWLRRFLEEGPAAAGSEEARSA